MFLLSWLKSFEETVRLSFPALGRTANTRGIALLSHIWWNAWKSVWC